MGTIRVVTVSSGTLMAASLEVALTAVPDVAVVGEASVHTALALVPRLAPDILIVDCTGQEADVAALLPQVHQRCPAIKVLLLAPAVDLQLCQVLATLASGSYLLWRDLDQTVLRCALTTLQTANLVTFSPLVASHLLARAGYPLSATEGATDLSEREYLVLEGLAAGLTQHEIAITTRISSRTVKRTVASLAARLGARSAFTLGARARELGLVAGKLIGAC